MFRAAAFEFSDPVTKMLRIYKEELHRLIRLCDIQLQCVGRYGRFIRNQLLGLQGWCREKLCDVECQLYYSLNRCISSWDTIFRLCVPKIGKVAPVVVSGLVILSMSCAVKGGISINIGAHMKTLFPVLFNISASKKTSSTVSVIPQSGDNVNLGPYDSSMIVMEGNCFVSNKSNMELGKAGSRLSFREESSNCQQQGAFTETIFTPVAPKRIEVDPQHLRKNGLDSEDDTLKGIHMMVGSHGTSADRSMQYMNIIILDSGAAYHCTGDRSQLSDYHDGVTPVAYLRGAGGTLMQVHGTGSIHNENFQVNDVLYVPGLNNQPNISKTIFSVSKLNELGFSVLFNRDGTSYVMNLEHEIVGKARNVRGVVLMDYLRVLDNRAPVAMLEGQGPGLLKSFWNASLSVWTYITGRLSQRTTSTQRLPV